MLRFLSSFTFLYAASICMLIAYGVAYYRSFSHNRTPAKWFPAVFGLISLLCMFFLFINMHPPLSLRTYSNLDHHFIRHDGYKAKGILELGGNDTVNFDNRNFNQFRFTGTNTGISLHAPYSEEPFYIQQDGKFKLASTNFNAIGHEVSFDLDSIHVSIRMKSEQVAILQIRETVCEVTRKIERGTTAWNLFKDDYTFIASTYFSNEKLISALRHIYLLREGYTSDQQNKLAYFISGRVFNYVTSVRYDNQVRTQPDLGFKVNLDNHSVIAWGLGFSDQNKKQFIIEKGPQDSFYVTSRYPVSYPLIEEENAASSSMRWKQHEVTKFLVSNSKDIATIPSVFREGFYFQPAGADTSLRFSPVLLSYRKDKGNSGLKLHAFWDGQEMPVAGNTLFIPVNGSAASWKFSIVDSRQWVLGKKVVAPATWQLLLLGSLFFFIVLVFICAVNRQQGWIWQILSTITLLLLTTRIFLYWRYKTFPPFEGMDLPSIQQLNSSWNFLIIIIAIILLALVFGFGAIRSGWSFIVRKTGRLFPSNSLAGVSPVLERTKSLNPIRKLSGRRIFFISWICVLVFGGAIAAISNFNPSVCRHLAIVLILLYFLFLYISYRHSPLVRNGQESWWSLATNRRLELLVNNPVKILLSVSLLALFSLVDIGFAIMFLNFLVFNEAFLCINYFIAGLSAGSRKNANLFGWAGAVYMLIFIFNLTYGPYIFRSLLEMPSVLYTGCYIVFAASLAYTIVRLLNNWNKSKRRLAGFGLTAFLFAGAFLFFPKEKILEKAAMTRYRIDVMAMPVEKAIEGAYADGKNYTPVIRAAQNQWFINTFIDDDNNPRVNGIGFNLMPHAPQNKGARYNAQATDLVASRFLIAEHGKWAVLFYVLLLMLPAILVASFYKLYPDFTNRVNQHYPLTNAAFALLNYLLVSALLVVLAATGRYIFFGQDLPFGSILSKQSILFPATIIISALLLFRHITPEQYPSRKKFIPGAIVMAGLMVLLFVFRPSYNRNKVFGAGEIAKEMDNYLQLRVQPVMDHFTEIKKLTPSERDRLFTDSLRKLVDAGVFADAGKFLRRELNSYAATGFSTHLNQDRMLFLDLNSGTPQIAVNENFFRIDPPPHLQQYWSGNVYGEVTNFNITRWESGAAKVETVRMPGDQDANHSWTDGDIAFVRLNKNPESIFTLVNTSETELDIISNGKDIKVKPGDTILLNIPTRIVIPGSVAKKDRIYQVEPDAFMKNYFVNGSRFYVYPMAERFIWARNFAENVSSTYTADGLREKNVFVSLDATLMDSLSCRISNMMYSDSAYHRAAEYGICVADDQGRLIAMADHVNGLQRPNPNDKAAFNKAILGENGFISQSLQRKQLGNINLLRMNPGPGSTLKPIIFSAIASQLNLDWDAFAGEGFSEKQQYFGGEKVGEYDFEKNNGRITTVKDYLRLSDNYYHANLLLLGSYNQQALQNVLSTHFATSRPGATFHWPWFSYKGRNYWLNGFENWPGFENGKANFGSDSSFVSIGLVRNFGIHTGRSGHAYDGFNDNYDSILFRNAAKRSGYLMPEYALFDQKGTGMNMDRPNEVFLSSFRGHVKGSSQVMMPPVKMVEAYGKLVSQNRNYTITLDPAPAAKPVEPFHTSAQVKYSEFRDLIKQSVFTGMKEALYNGTASALGSMLKNGSPYYYYAKTGTTGDDAKKEKSKLFVIIISKKDITAPGYNFRDNKFYTVYFTSQNGPPKQNEKFQAAVIRMIESSTAFKKYMKAD